jgi:hypothetical protein
MSFSRDLKKVVWLQNFKPPGINKYDGSTNPTEWLEVYTITIEAVGGDSYVMANYLLIWLSSSARTWHMGSQWDLSVRGQTCVDNSSATSGPPMSDRESIGTWITSCRRRENHFGNSSSVSTKKEHYPKGR